MPPPTKPAGEPTTTSPDATAPPPPSLSTRFGLALVDLLGARRFSLVRHGPRQAAGGARRIALTFDDGPDPHTPAYLAALARQRARATFFVTGKAASARPALLAAIGAAGHEVASHGYSHTPLPLLEADEMSYELAHTAALLPPPRGPRPLLRPAHGALSFSTLTRIASLGYTTVLWSVDAGDRAATTAAAVAAAVAPERVQPGDIVLFHEGRPWTREALPAIVAQLTAAGFELVTVSELLG